MGRRNLIRWAAFSGSAVLAAVVLLAASANFENWLRRLHDRGRLPVPRAAHSPPNVPTAALPRIPTQGPPKPLAGAQSSTSATPQELILTGTIVGKSAREGYAMLGVARENPQTYAAGAVLANGARISEIHARYVVLERDGYSARLYLEGSSRPVMRGPPGNLLMVGGASPPKAAVATSTELLTDYIRPAPVYTGAILAGYQVYPGRKSAAFLQMGFQPGDIITAVDGVILSDPEQATQTLRQLMDGTVHTGNIIRTGKTQRLTLDGSLIAKDQDREKQPVMMTTDQLPGS